MRAARNKRRTLQPLVRSFSIVQVVDGALERDFLPGFLDQDQSDAVPRQRPAAQRAVGGPGRAGEGVAEAPAILLLGALGPSPVAARAGLGYQHHPGVLAL